ncbi:MAG TPA: discoidin domain-containing protein [Vicinamibacterales bacterium]|nr:discoidin domain-containing protein [Vicinamibacterales bacterium]
MTQGDATAHGLFGLSTPPEPDADGRIPRDQEGTPSTRQIRLAALASALFYIVVTAILGRDVLAHLSTTVAHDAGDPLLTAAILKWNATHWPLTDAWWQFPIFYPTRDTMAFSEHLLGLSVIASPIYWITRDTLVTSNLVTLLTFPLCAMAMYALVFRLTRNVAGAFIAGLAFGFAPYRIPQLPHVQMLAAFWAPLALLGLHAYLETRRRRWLVLYGATWMLQGATNGYALVYFSILIGLWVVWFVLRRSDWRALGAISLVTAVAALPLAAVLHQYVLIHTRQAFFRSVAEIVTFSADVGGILCAAADLSVWGWLRVSCRGEGELFPGLVVVVLWLIASIRSVRRVGVASTSSSSRLIAVVLKAFIAIGVIYLAIVASVLLHGPWRLDIGVLHISVTSVRKPALIALGCLGIALLPPLMRGAVHRSSAIGFYLMASVATWLLALGPVIRFMGVPSGFPGPFAWLLALPGASGLRVPARFWLMTTLCLAIIAGITLPEIIRGRSRRVQRALIALATIGLLADGWTSGIPAVAAPAPVPGAEFLRRATVFELPADGTFRDITAVFQAVEGGWRTVNGYSGFQPNYYFPLVSASRNESSDVVTPFQRLGELRVLVPSEAPRLKALLEAQPGATLIAQNGSLIQYRLPARKGEDAQVAGRRVEIREVRSECSSTYVHVVKDGDEQSLWLCSLTDDRQPLIADLGGVTMVGSIVYSVGTQFWLYPRTVDVETSEDGQVWAPARTGSVLHDAIVAGLREPGRLRMVLAFSARPARYVRLRGTAGESQFPWTIAELEIWSDARGIH